MTTAGADVVVVQGVAKAKDLDRAAIQLEKTARRVKAVNSHAIVLCDGEPGSESALYISRNCPAVAGLFTH
jgi:predicted TIM-barrel enzyme